MRTYKVGSEDRITRVETNTSEFKKMQQLFYEMVGRIEHDYKNLKEYTENMAHEIQTPLAIIRSKTETLIADDSLMENHAATVKTIYDETNHISNLGNTLNLLTKIENQEFTKTEVLQTKPIIEKHLESISDVANLKSLQLEQELSEDHTIDIDPLLLDIVLKNLLKNALRYGSPEGPVRFKTTEKKLSISNYGQPIEGGHEKLFERFFRQNGTRSSQGLGLALVKKICELNNLRINYTYQDNQHFFTIVKKMEMSEKGH